ncbi:Uncharacterized protein LC1Hm_0559 [Halomicrobium sp. LC1Hm]|nr:Uncharacterized protein LC1Hm_0559 [Halomicrobium sp. LC1Hm]
MCRLTRFRVRPHLYPMNDYEEPMPQITVSDQLYRKLEEATEDRDTEDAMWEMVYRFDRGNNPSE